jgi:FtsX-like permease family
MPQPPGSRSACSAPPRRSCWASTRCSPASGSGSPAPAPTAMAAYSCTLRESSAPTCSPPTSTHRCWSGPVRGEPPELRRPTPPRSASRRPTARSTRSTSCSRARPTPQDPTGVSVSQPSDALVAQAAVLERRSEIGLRRALGAPRGHIRIQFLAEAIVLSLLGVVAGIITGAAATAIYARGKSWATVIPPTPESAAWPPPSSSAPPPGCCPSSAPRARRLTEALWRP